MPGHFPGDDPETASANFPRRAIDRTRRNRTGRRFGTVVLLVLLVSTVAAGTASAHDVLVSAQPANGASITAGPPTVQLIFDKPVQHGFTEVDVVGPGNTHWSAGPPTIYGNTVDAALRPLGPAGDYTISYRIVSADGHPVSGRTVFTLTAAGTGTPASAPIAAQPTASSTMASATASGMDNSGMSLWVWLAATCAVVLLGLLLALRITRRQ